jgi:hypothetical protein
MAYRNGTEAGKDDFGYLAKCNGDKKLIDEQYDLWDIYYGVHPYSYDVYVLTDGTRPIKLNFGLLEFFHDPFYVGHGDIRKRVRESKALGRQKDKYCLKTIRMIEIVETRGGSIRPVIIGRFQTKEKAALVERKIMNTIPRSFLCNGTINYCEIPLTLDDCNVMHPPKGEPILSI